MSKIKVLMDELAEMVNREKSIEMADSYKFLVQSKLVQVAEEINVCETNEVPKDIFGSFEPEFLKVAVIGLCVSLLQGVNGMEE